MSSSSPRLFIIVVEALARPGIDVSKRHSTLSFPVSPKALETAFAAAHCFKPLVKVLDERPLCWLLSLPMAYRTLLVAFLLSQDALAKVYKGVTFGITNSNIQTLPSD